MRTKVFSWMLPLLFSIVVGVPVILPYLHAGYFETHDGEWAVVRLADMFRTVRDMQVPARYSGNLNFGYGYPLFNFTYPMPYYAGTLIHFLGIGFVDTIKILFAVSVPLSAFFMFQASRLLWKNAWAGVVSTILYVYFPYRMVDLYVRGSIGESLSFVLFPFLIYLGIKLVEKPSFLLISAISFSVGILITTHNIMTVLFMPIFIVFMITYIIVNKKKIIKPFIVSIILGFGVSAFFWIPALFERNNILLSQIPIADRSLYFVTLNQFLFPRWGYSPPTDPNGFSYQLGLPHLSVLVLTVFVFFLTIRHSGESRLAGRIQNLFDRFMALGDSGLPRMTVLLISIILLYVFVLFKPSAFLWDNLPLLSEINYPWTVLGILGFLVSLLAGFLCIGRWARYIAICFSFLAIVMVLPYAKPQYYIDKGDNYYLTNDATTTSSNELMPLWVKKIPLQRLAEKVEIVEGKGKVENVSYNSKKITFSVLAKEDTKVRINTIYYPGWNVFVNDQKSDIDYGNEKGLMELKIPKGENKVELKFSETPIRLFVDLLSLLSFVALIFFVIAFSPKRSKIKARNIEVAKLFHL